MTPCCFAAQTILILGDSLSAGYGIDVQHGWVVLLQDQLHQSGYDYQVINASISGDSTDQGMQRLTPALQRYHPQIVIIELGGNDALRGIQLNTTKSNLSSLIKTAKANHAKVLLLGLRLPPNYGPTYTQQFQALYPTLAKQFGVAIVPLFLNGVDSQTELMQDDGIHPKEAAQPIMLNNVWPVLRPLL